jgi:hypothetical protein
MTLLLYPGESAPGTYWIGDWVNPRTDLDYVEKEISSLYQDWKSDLSVVQFVASRYTDYAIPADINYELCIQGNTYSLTSVEKY